MAARAVALVGWEGVMPLKWRCRSKGYHSEKLHPEDTAWISEMINGVKRRQALGTRNEQEAIRLYRDKMKEWELTTPDPSKSARRFKRLSIAEAITVFIEERKADVSPGQLKGWKTNASTLAEYFKDARLDQITNEQITEYKNHRLASNLKRRLGKVKPKSVNNELATLRLILKRADQWFRVRDKFKMAKVNTWREGRALSDEHQARLFSVAQSKESYRWGYALLVLGYYCGMRPCECFGLQWRDIDWNPKNPLLEIRRSKTQAGFRNPSLNSICLEALTALYERAKGLDMAEPDHHVFPYHPKGRWRHDRVPFDPTRPMTRYQNVWDAIRKEAGLEEVWFYDGRHTARTKMAEMGLPDEVMDAQMGHVSKTVGKRYSHIRREALRKAAAALEPPDAVKKILIITPEADKDATVQ
jgi:integrase